MSPPDSRRGRPLGKAPSADRPESRTLTATLSRPPFPFRLTITDCTALARCNAATTVVHTWRDVQLWSNRWQAFDLPTVDAQHPCVGCPVLAVARDD